MNGLERYFEIIRSTLNEVLETQREEIERAAEVMAQTIQLKKRIYVFGCSHGGILAEELFYRAGGLAVINPIFNPSLMLNIKPVTLTSSFERMEGQSRALLLASKAQKGDCILIHSVSGRNPGIVEMALTAKELGLTVIGLTNRAYSEQSSSRDKSGKLLYQICDICIDNKGTFGDGCVSLPGVREKAGPTSTVIGAAIVNGITVRTAELLLERGIVPPILHSANADGGDEINQRMFDEYRDSILYL